ncbi:hypothetical protein O181_129779 [Austropuccinia psidii MF-1]|uniref:Uncharacterized protein n=1 Tax=Austropuccinia psidii MF-1 TaxID=1389203 RepID=A0A9Q3L2K3_9BASI|nr:hypothetical protein [Austropuccinia psidii MF-1]
MVRGPWAVDRPKWTPWAQICWGSKEVMGPKMAQIKNISPLWPGPIGGVQDHQTLAFPKVAGEALGDDSSPQRGLGP